MNNINKKLIFVASFIMILGLVFAPVANAAGGGPVTLVLPTVTATAATNITTTSADLNGTVNPNSMTTSAWFEFNSTNYGTQNGLTGSSAIPMTYTLTGLTPNTTYSFEVGAINGSGMVTSNTVNFTTASVPAATPPTLSGVSASGITSSTATLNGTVNPNGSPTSAWFDFNSTNYATQNGINSVTPMSYTLTGLTPNTTYSFRMEAINAGGPVLSSTINFTTASLPSNPTPTVVTLAATGITPTSAVLNGSVNPNGYSTSAWFDFNSTNYNTQNGLTGVSAIPMTYTLTGLTPNTNYSYRIEAINANGTTVGNTVTFTTGSISGGSAPTITTDVATSITKNSAELNGTYNDNGASTSTWFEWGPTISLGTSTSPVVQPTSVGPASFNDSLSGLSASTVYFYRAVGQNSNGTTFGSILSFTTNAANGGGGGGGGAGPSVSTKDATNVSVSGATLNGYVTPKNTTTRWFQWGTNSNALSNSTASVNIATAGDISDVISGLQPNTTYFFRAAASNANSIKYGATLSFKTPEGNPLKPVTSLGSAVGQTTARINGLVLNAGTGADSWFEYGKTAALGNKGAIRNVSGASTEVSNLLSGLTPNTIYFFRLVGKNSIGTVNGEIKIFKTLSTAVPPVEIGDETGESLISISIEAAPTTVSRNDEVNFTVTYKNTSDKDLKDVVVRVVLPNDIKFASSSIGDYDSEDTTLTANVGSLNADEEGIITLSGTVSEDAVDQDVLVTTASVVYTDGDSQGDALDYALIDVSVDPNLLAAASIFGSGFLPSTLLGWMVLLLVVLGLIMLGRKLYVEVNWATVMSSFRKGPPTNLPM